MTPQEKAKELLRKFYSIGDIECKQCALIAVDLVINQWEYIDTYLADANGELNPNLKYWYEVKQEIQKL